jgi:hypothetical protein
VVRALSAIEASIDPCGQSPEVSDLLAKFRRCARNAYPVCIDRTAERNSTDRAQLEGDGRVFITWNPALRTELQTGCGSDPTRIVRRDPTASFLHEIAHVVQDCSGLDPNAHELEAVRIENIYRRAQSLCQRTAYGDRPLPDAMVVECHPGRCTCTPRDLQIAAPPGTIAPSSAAVAAGDAAHADR